MTSERPTGHLDRRWIEAHLPHQGTMCLLDEILSWDESHAHCRARSHRSHENPLRAFSRLGAACGIEYAAQAMAVHGALMASTTGNRAPAGLLASVRGVQLLVERLDVIDADLVASVTRLNGDERTALYAFSLRTAGDALAGSGRLLLSGRAAIAFLLPKPASLR